MIERIRCRRSFFALAPTFELSDEQGNLLLYGREKSFALKDEVRIFTDRSKTAEAFRLKQKNILREHGEFEVIASESLGTFKRMGRSWSIYGPDGNTLCAFSEGGASRLHVGLGLGAQLSGLLLGFMPRTFAFTVGDRPAGSFREHATFFGYTATLTLEDLPPGFDRRLALAGAVLLAAFELIRR